MVDQDPKDREPLVYAPRPVRGMLASVSPPWRVAWFLFFVGGLNYADRSALSAVIPPLREELGASDTDIGIMGSLFLWTYAVVSVVAGSVADRYSRRAVIIWSLAVWSGIMLLTGFATSVSQLYFLRTGLGIAQSFYLPAAAALLGDYHGSTTRGRAMGLHLTGLHVGALAGGLVAGSLAEYYGWRWGFWLLGGTGIILAMMSGVLLPRSPTAGPMVRVVRPKATTWPAFAYLARTPSYYVMLASAVIVGVASWTLATWLPLYFRENYGMGLGRASLTGLGLYMAPVLVGLSISGWISDSAARKSARYRVLLKALSFLASAPFLLLFIGTPSVVVVGTALALSSLIRSLGSANEHPIICDVVPPAFRSTAVGLLNMCGTAAGGAGVLLTGVLKQELGLGLIFSASAFLFTFAGILLVLSFIWFVPRDISRAGTHEEPSI